MTNKYKKRKVDPALRNAQRRWKRELASQKRYADSSTEQFARSQMGSLYYRLERNRESTNLTSAVAHATASLGRAVINSMNVTVPLTVDVNRYLTGAVTDFKQIKIRITDNMCDTQDEQRVRRFIHFVKGLIYHEVGHIKYTVPVPIVFRDAGLSVETFFDDNQISPDYFRVAWNYMEDQRMECAMVRESPIMSAYFNVIVADYVVGDPRAAWPVLAGRTYLPKSALDAYRQQAHEMVDSIYPTLVTETSACISRYKRATDAQTMIDCVLEFMKILKRWHSITGVGGTKGPGDHPERWSPTNDETEWEQVYERGASREEEIPISPPPPPDTPEKDSGKGDQTSDNKDNNEDDDGDANGDYASTEADGDMTRTNEDRGQLYGNDDDDDKHNHRGASHSKNTNDTPPPPPTREDIAKQLADSAREIIKNNKYADQEVTDFLSTVNNELGKSMPRNTAVLPLTSDDLANVDEIYRGILLALETLAVQSDPTLRFRQEQGILDVAAYTFREPGDTDYWVGKDGDGSTGFDLAVSILLDTSSSMINDWCRKNGIAALAIRRACDDLKIPCTVTTFSDNGRALWRADEEPFEVFPYADGGTQPMENLDELDEERYGKERHLVVILTDGQWSGVHNLGHYHAPGRYFMCVALGNPFLIEYLKTLNAHSSIAIDSPLELPEHVTRALAGFLA